MLFVARAPGASPVFQAPTWIAALPAGLAGRAGAWVCAKTATEAAVAAKIRVIIRRIEITSAPVYSAPMIEHTLVEAAAFPGWDSFGAMAAHFRFVRDHHKHLKKIAVVTDSAMGNLAES